MQKKTTSTVNSTRFPSRRFSANYKNIFACVFLLLLRYVNNAVAIKKKGERERKQRIYRKERKRRTVKTSQRACRNHLVGRASLP